MLSIDDSKDEGEGEGKAYSESLTIWGVTRERSAWLYNWNYQAEHTVEAIARTCKDYGITALHQEVMYGLQTQGNIDHYQNGGEFGSPCNVSEFVDFSNAMSAHDIKVVPVVVPRGLVGEAELYAQYFDVNNVGIVDMEVERSPTQYFPYENVHLVKVFARALHEACNPLTLIGWQPDPRIMDANRESEAQPIVYDCLEYIDFFMPQLYSGYYGFGSESVNKDIKRFVAFNALKDTYPLVWTANRAIDFRELYVALHTQHNVNGFGMFRFGATDAPTLTIAQSLEITPIVKPEPKPKPEPEPDEHILYAVKLGLIKKVINDQWREAYEDIGKIVDHRG